MKTPLFLIMFISLSFGVHAKDVPMNDDSFIEKINADFKSLSIEKQIEVTNMQKSVAYMQRNYEEKINFLEIELSKTKERLIEKSLNEEQIQYTMKERYDVEINNLRKELASRTRTALEYQRQIEKMNPTEDTKKLIQLNTELAADLRKTEGHLAVLELEVKKNVPTTNKTIILDGARKLRMPASVEEK